MAIDVKVPGVGESVQEGMIESWHKESGDWVEQDEVLLELETDKATVELAAEVAGKLTIKVQAGEVVKVGDVVATIDQETSQNANSSPSSKVDQSADKGADTGEKEREHGPAVNRLLKENSLSAGAISASGKDGRLTKGDVLSHLDKTPQAKSGGEAKNIAKEPSETAKPQASVQAREGRQETKKPMSMLRRKIAQRLIESQQNAAILTTFNEVDMTAVIEMRKLYKDKFQDRYGIKLGFMGFFLQASVHALKACPDVNAYINGNDLLYHNYCDIGVAVSTAKGLMVPIIRDVDRLTLAEVEGEIARFAAKARDNKISLEDLSGGTFTVSNGGVFGSLLSTPILNPPQSAILGMHKTQMRAMVMPNGSIEARPMMYLALSYDHRIIDGKEAVGFLVKIKEAIEDPSRLLLGV